MIEKSCTELKKTALNLLTRREHSQKELRNKLKLRKFDDQAIETTIKDLALDKLQSDIRFAESYTQMRITRGYGPQRIKLELNEKGITAELIDQVMQQFDKQFWLEQICKVQQKKFGKKVSTNLTEKIKQMRFLQYRGFTQEQIKQIM